MELQLALSPGPLRPQLEHALRTGVREGRLAPGARLPSSRALAGQLGVARGTVVEVYAQLAAEGYLVSRQGARTTVAPRPPHAVPTPAPAASASTLRYDLTTGRPDLGAFPRRAWLAAGARALGAAPDALLGYGDPRGALALRDALAAYLGRARGVVAHPDRVLVCAGLTQGLALVCAVLRERGVRRVGIEDPGWRTQRSSVLAAGLEPVPVPVDERGLVVGELVAAGAQAVVVTPAHQFPTGVVLASERRAELVAWAQAAEAYVVEDDYDAEFRYDREPVGALQGLAPERVVYAGSASKILAPALRLGWLVLPAALVAGVAAAKGRADHGNPLLDQLALADLLERGELDRHLRRARRHYRARRNALVKALAEQLPEAQVTGVAAGLHVTAQLPAGWDEAAIVAAAATRGVAVQGLARDCAVHRPQPPALLLGYGALPEPALARAVAELAAIQ